MGRQGEGTVSRGVPPILGGCAAAGVCRGGRPCPVYYMRLCDHPRRARRARAGLITSAYPLVPHVSFLEAGRARSGEAAGARRRWTSRRRANLETIPANMRGGAGGGVWPVAAAGHWSHRAARIISSRRCIPAGRPAAALERLRHDGAAGPANPADGCRAVATRVGVPGLERAVRHLAARQPTLIVDDVSPARLPLHIQQQNTAVQLAASRGRIEVSGRDLSPVIIGDIVVGCPSAATPE
jgi:hypothetical protein